MVAKQSIFVLFCLILFRTLWGEIAWIKQSQIYTKTVKSAYPVSDLSVCNLLWVYHIGMCLNLLPIIHDIHTHNDNILKTNCNVIQTRWSKFLIICLQIYNWHIRWYNEIKKMGNQPGSIYKNIKSIQKYTFILIFIGVVNNWQQMKITLTV